MNLFERAKAIILYHDLGIENPYLERKINKFKYLLNYKMFESTEQIDIDTIKDICLEFQDEGFTVSEVSPHHISIKNPNFIIKPIKFEKIKDTVLRLKDYLGDHMTKFKYGWYDKSRHNMYSRHLPIDDLTENIILHDPITEIVINYISDPDEVTMSKIIEFLNKKYEVHLNEIPSIGLQRYIVVDDKPVVIYGVLRNKGDAVNKIFYDVIDELSDKYNWQLVRKAVKMFIDNLNFINY